MMLRAADSAVLLLPAVGCISAVYEAILACVAANTQRNLQRVGGYNHTASL